MNVNNICPYCGKLCNMKKDEYIKPKRSARQYFHLECGQEWDRQNKEKIRRAEDEHIR